IYEVKRITSMAFMDNTVWVTKDKEEMEEILEVAESFFKLNKIKVNPMKSELLIINSKAEDKVQGIDFMNNKIIPKQKEAVRYLGVWINEKGGKKFQKELINEKVTMTTSLMMGKHMTDKQC